MKLRSLLSLALVFALAPVALRASDYSVTATSVVPLGTTNVYDEGGYTAAVAITAGQLVYVYDASAKTLKLADANDTSATAVVYGVAMNGAAIGQPVRVLRKGRYAPGFTGAASTIVILSGTAGGLAPTADIVTGWRAVVIGVMPAASQLTVDFTATAFATSAATP